MAELPTWEELRDAIQGKDYAVQSLMVLHWTTQRMVDQWEEADAVPPYHTELVRARLGKERVVSLERAIKILEEAGIR